MVVGDTMLPRASSKLTPNKFIGWHPSLPCCCLQLVLGKRLRIQIHCLRRKTSSSTQRCGPHDVARRGCRVVWRPHIKPAFDEALFYSSTPATHQLTLTLPRSTAPLVFLYAAAVSNLQSFQHGLSRDADSGTKDDDAKYSVKTDHEALNGCYRHDVAKADGKCSDDGEK